MQKTSSDSGNSRPDRFRSDVRRLAEETERRARRHPAAWGFGLGVVVAVAMAAFIAQNTHQIDLEWLWMDFSAAVWAALLVSFAAGAVAAPALVFGALALRSRRKRIGELAKGVRERDHDVGDFPPPEPSRRARRGSRSSAQP